MRPYFIRSIRIGLALASLAIVLDGSAVAAAEIEPYEARVIVARAQIRSGPGDNFYPTDALPAGETVEVYREAEGGWLAIRPPRESFSWVFGRHLKLGEKGLAEIDKPEVDSRIGSRFGPQRNAVQVRLRKGEVVEILGEESAGNETWYKIAPPAGEFRWIHATHVQRGAPLAVHVPDSGEESDVVNTSGTEDKTPLEAPPLPPAAATDATAPTRDTGSAWRSSSAAETAPTVDASGSPASAPSAISTTPIGERPTSGTPNPTGSGSPIGDLQRQLTDIELRLSRMVAAPISQWNTDRLELDTENLLAAAQTPADREAVKSTLAKLDHFAELARRAQQPVGSIAAGAGNNPAVPAANPIAATTASPADSRQPTADSQYDAVGILRPVVSKRPGAPQFALVDDRGQVLSFVTPTPDMNLQPYVGRRIAVNGTRGFISEFQRAHVTAGRVTPLNQPIMR